MRYSSEDKALLKANVKHNAIVSEVVDLFSNPKRSEWAIIRQAQILGFGVDSRIDGIKRFALGKGTRRSNTKIDLIKGIETEVGDTEVIERNFTPTSEEDFRNKKSDGIVASLQLENDKKPEVVNNIFSANRKAMKIIVSNSLSASSDDVKYLTDLIIRSKPA